MISLSAPEIIRAKRDGAALCHAQVQAFVDGITHGITTGGWSEGQVAAMAMAILLRGMERAETVLLTMAMTDSGERLSWHDAHFHGPVLDKHSTGGVGDKISLMLAPVIAACGGVVPMLSGRGLGHTGGTLDKLEALSGYNVSPDRPLLLHVLRDAGCAIIGASERLAPADRRLYAIRDVTATVESLPLITASILSKKLAAGLQALVMDVKVGNGAFCATRAEADALARCLVDVAQGAGLPTVALVTDMNQLLGRTAGNALEVREAIDFLTGSAREPRLLELTLTLAGQMLHLGGLAATPEAGEAKALRALDDGTAAERFERMVAGLGGPPEVLRDARLPTAPVARALPSPRRGWLAAMDTRALGLAVVALGGGRQRPGDRIDARVGLADALPLGTAVAAGERLLTVHAASEAEADAALAALTAVLHIADEAPAPTPTLHARFAHESAGQEG